jgi:hypothetical protein
MEIRPSLIAASLMRARAMTTGERAATMLTPRTEGRVKARRRTAIAWAGAIACVAMLAMASMRRAPAAAHTEADRAPIAAAGLVAPSTLTASTADSAAVSATPAPVAASPMLSASAAHGKPAASSHPFPTPSSQRRTLFGDRK